MHIILKNKNKKQYLMKLINFSYLNETFGCFDFVCFSIHGAKFVTESKSVFLKFELVSRELVLLLISFMAENACSYLYFVSERHIKLRADVL